MKSNSLHSLPVYRKSLVLRDLSDALASYLSYNKDLFSLRQSSSFRDNLSDSLLTDATLITKEIEQAATSSSYSVRMKSLSFINIMTRNILAYCNGLERDGVKEKEYLNLLRKEIKSFRKAFKKWRLSLRNDEY
ncbi:hypothetical protein [Flagellimonas lutaonensis]|uniref:Four helix bundle protein n=1 Tax=Flagellimonas lutaonensis TaxID=516051 RepID=A0A0D5YQI2_9FLAO|nr:hypothetical protein [Allomuricauda lutaonensis]AKA34184.1 hypothetical protein VC82_505 [Allomuricauda lutaonensis]